MPHKAKATGTAADASTKRRGEGSVHEYPKGSGRFHIEIPNPDGGKPLRRRAAGATTREEAHAQREAFYLEVHSRKASNLHALKGDMTLKQFVNAEWWPAVMGRNLAPKTLADYGDTVNGYLIPDWGQVKLKNFDVNLVLRINAQLTREYSPPIAYNALRKLSMVLRSARAHHYITYNAVEDARSELPKIRRKKPPTLTYAQLHQVLAATANDRVAILWHLEVLTGLRLGELLGIHKTDIDWDAGTITIQRQSQEIKGRKHIRERTKTDAGDRLLAVPPKLLQALRVYVLTLGDTPWLFPNARGGQWSPSNFEDHWNGKIGRVKKDGSERSRTLGVKERAGLPDAATMHGFRHTANNHMMELGVPVEIRQKLLGWGAKNIAQHYTSATVRAMHRAMAAYEQELWAHSPHTQQPLDATG